MTIFPIKFNVGCVELEAIVTASDDQHRFKIELVTGEADPIVLRKGSEAVWVIENPGGRALSAEAYESIEKEIEAKWASI
ncbi:MAG: hypothetical protein V4594_03550 [Bacteroidota bacterium]